MRKPLIAIFSEQTSLTSSLPAFLQDRFDCLIVDSLEEIGSQMSAHPAWGLLLDWAALGRQAHREANLWAELRRQCPQTKLIVLSGNGSPQKLNEQLPEAELWADEPGVEQIAERLKDAFGNTEEEENEAPSAEETANTQATSGLIKQRFGTRTPAMIHMLEELEIAAGHDVTILLIGETGSGKTYASRLIHQASPRREEPFLHVACGALPAALIQSEMFGHVKGAFTGAHADKDGKFVAARRGTILLDEIDVLDPEQQVKLLRVIETGEFEPVGSNQTLHNEARLVVASNLDLEPLVEEGEFRSDLYYRLNMMKFEILPLRRRKPDIVPLAQKFIEELAAKHQISIERIEPEFFDALLAYSWPGNVRELENVIQRAVIFCQNGLLSRKHLPPHVLAGTRETDPEFTGKGSGSSNRRETSAARSNQLGDQIAITEREIIEQALLNNNYSRTNTAKELGVSRVTLYNKMKKYGMSEK